MFSEKGKELLAALEPDWPRVRRLLAEGASLEEIDPEEGQTVFDTYVENRHSEITGLIEAGAKATHPLAWGLNALVFAVWGRDYGLFRRLLDYGADPNALLYGDGKDLPPTTLLDEIESERLGLDVDPGSVAVLEAMRDLAIRYGARA